MCDKIIDLALKEDLEKRGDITSQAIFGNETADFILIAKENGILCGVEYFSRVFARIDKNISLIFNFKDGDEIQNQDLVAEISGPVLSILTGERVALNFLSHLSGISTKTKKFVNCLDGKTKILDTRKTIPGLRKAEKYAVKCGGGVNHRMGLYDMVLIKDNHIDSVGGITQAVEKVINEYGNSYLIEVETRNLQEVEEALACKVDRIMLDNMKNTTMIKVIQMCKGKVKLEASGNMNREKVKKIGGLGLEYISVGELTHSVNAFDFSLQFKHYNKPK